MILIGYRDNSATTLKWLVATDGTAENNNDGILYTVGACAIQHFFCLYLHRLSPSVFLLSVAPGKIVGPKGHCFRKCCCRLLLRTHFVVSPAFQMSSCTCLLCRDRAINSEWQNVQLTVNPWIKKGTKMQWSSDPKIRIQPLQRVVTVNRIVTSPMFQ